MAQTATYEIGLDTPIHMLTPRQLFEMQAGWQASHAPAVAPQQECKQDRWFVNKIGDLAEILGTSKSTIHRMKSSGLLDDAISQFGHWMTIDVNKVIDILKLSKRKKFKK